MAFHMSLRRALALCAMTLAVFTAGCGGGDGAPPVSQEQPPPQGGGEPGPQPQPGQGTDTRTWTAAATLDPNPAGFGLAQKVVMNASGEGFALWTRMGNAWVSRYSPASGWGAPHELVDSDAGNALQQASIAMDAAGNAVAVWYAPDPDSIRYSVWGARFTPAAGWSAGELLESDNSDDASDVPRVAMDGEGNAYAVWRMSGEDGGSIRFRHFSAAAGWGVGGLVPDSEQAQLGSPGLAVGPGGDATIAWSYKNESNDQVVITRRHTPSGGWFNAQVIATVENPRNSNLWEAGVEVRADAQGRLVAVWRQVREDAVNQFQLWSARRVPGEAWTGRARVDTGGVDTYVHDFAMDADAAGNTVVAWTQETEGESSQEGKVFAARQAPGSAWSTPVRVSAPNEAVAYGPAVAMDGQGGAVLLWVEAQGNTSQLVASRLRSGEWSAPENLDTPVFELYVPRVAVNAAGKALAAWTRNTGTGSYTVHGSALQ